MRPFLVVTLVFWFLFTTGCKVNQKAQASDLIEETTEIIVQLQKNADIESLQKEFEGIKLISKKVLSSRMSTWLMTIQVTKTDIGASLEQLKAHDNIINAQLNHKNVEQRK